LALRYSDLVAQCEDLDVVLADADQSLRGGSVA
jgi:hypothetical protein